MAINGPILSVPGLVAGSDLSAKQFYFVKFDPSGSVIPTTAAGERCIGVVQNAPASGDVAEVAPVGSGLLSKVKLGSAVTAGTVLQAASDGSGITAAGATGAYVAGVAAETGVAGQVIAVLLSSLAPSA